MKSNLKKFFTKPYIAMPIVLAVLIAVTIGVISLVVSFVSHGASDRSDPGTRYVSMNNIKSAIDFQDRMIASYPFIDSVYMQCNAYGLNINISVAEKNAYINQRVANEIQNAVDDMLQSEEFLSEFDTIRSENFKTIKSREITLSVQGLDTEHPITVDGETVYDPIYYYQSYKPSFEDPWEKVTDPN